MNMPVQHTGRNIRAVCINNGSSLANAMASIANKGNSATVDGNVGIF